MTFASPGMLGLLGLVPLLIIIHALKAKARRAPVTQLFLWEEVLRERGRQVRFERLKKNLPLLFQIATVICLAGALADPVATGFTQPLGRMILVVDTSASMQARVPAGTRFELARREALALIERLGTGQQALVIEAGSEPVLHADFQDDPRAVRRLIESLSASDAPAKLGKALHLALSFVDPAGADYVYLITDGGGAAGADLPPPHPRIVHRIVADGGRNVGITRFEFARVPDDTGTYELLLEIGNFSAGPVDCPVRLSIDDMPLSERSVRLEAREQKALIFTYTGLVAGVAKAVLGIDDDLGVDNAAYLAFNTAADLWVLLVSRGNIFLEKILGAYPHVRVNATREIVASS
ncbi:MAG: BatA domain-containing protein, partial [Desulfobacterales bacterium]|nr:BatA domain-containing protein [Desulfobacterales bacterium]